jgi:hypothetical protein
MGSHLQCHYFLNKNPYLCMMHLLPDPFEWTIPKFSSCKVRIFSNVIRLYTLESSLGLTSSENSTMVVVILSVERSHLWMKY